MSTAYHPQSDGQLKALNRCLEMYLRCFTMDEPKGWSKMLPWAEYCYNTSFRTNHYWHDTIQGSLWKRPPTLPKYVKKAIEPLSLQEMMLHHDQTLLCLK